MSIQWTLTAVDDVCEEIKRLTGIVIRPIKSPHKTTYGGIAIAVLFGFLAYFCG